MTRALEIEGLCAAGKLVGEPWKRLTDALRRMEGKRVCLSLRPLTRRRSVKQNKYYWGVVIPYVAGMFNDAGNAVDDEEVHEYLKAHVGGLTKVIIDPAGETVTAVRSSALLTTQEFENYLETIRAWAANFGLIIPLPREGE